MHIPPLAAPITPAPKTPDPPQADDPKLREPFDQFVGEVVFSQLLASMRKTVKPPAYFHGGRAEEIFQGQLDQALAQEMTKASASQFSDPLFDLFTQSRRP